MQEFSFAVRLKAFRTIQESVPRSGGEGRGGFRSILGVEVSASALRPQDMRGLEVCGSAFSISSPSCSLC